LDDVPRNPREPFLDEVGRALDEVGRALAEAEQLKGLSKDTKARIKQSVQEPRDRARAQAKEAKERAKQQINGPRQRVRDERAAHRHAHDHHHLWWMRPDRAAGRRGARDRAEVTAELIEAALRIADEDGYDAVSMRRLATEVGMGTMSLYWYVESKDELLDLVLDHLIGTTLLEPAELADWRTGLTAIATGSRAIYLAHPWLVQVIGQRPTIGPNMLRHVDQSLCVVDGLPIPMEVRMQILHTVDDYVVGSVLREAADTELARELGMSESEWHEQLRPHFEALIEAEDLGYLARFIDEQGFEPRHGKSFESGLELVFAGIDALLARHATG
jgi:AcrR family transcriptional regulator